MNKTIILISLTLCLSGCSNNAKIEQLDQNIQALNSKINQLQQDINALRPEIQAAKDEAARANYRIDDRNSPFSPIL
ncbi:hypothetical protein RNE61_001955 [Salmonella enterica]|nr:hypothetical protein [Salmonella enterica]